ncbi:MAG TPA: BPSS1780 family membrane protein [Burkholderiales bacterium]|nr:BPSS1780 family membrane protein [Burkholderiales bacterium]
MTTNPYAAPKATIAADTITRGGFIPGGRSVAAKRGGSWIGDAWGLFRRAAGVWIAIIIVLTVIFLVAAFIPLIGMLATMIFFPVFAGGLMIGCREVEEDRLLEFSHLFAGFRQHFGTLAKVGALYLGGSIIVTLLVALLAGPGMFALFGGAETQPEDVATMGMAFLLILALSLPLAMAVWFAAPLVVFHQHSAFDAMKGSFTGCLRNVLPFSVYGIVMLVLALVATVPIMLGWLVLGPVLAASVYTAYTDIYLNR